MWAAADDLEPLRIDTMLYLRRYGSTYAWLGKKLGYSASHIRHFVCEKRPISRKLAISLKQIIYENKL